MVFLYHINNQLKRKFKIRKSLEIQLQVSEKRQALADVTEKLNGHSREGTNPEEALLTRCDELTKEVRSLEVQFRSAVVEEDVQEKEVETSHNDELSSEDREIRSLEGKAQFSDYVSAALEMRGVKDGAASEFNAALGLGGNQFPMQKLAPSEVEIRQTTDTDTATIPRRWVDRLFYGTAAARLGITFESVPAGIASFPVTTAGGTSAQRARSQAASASAWTIGVTELKPTRNAINGIFSVEDIARVPSLEEAIVRDLRAAIVAQIDKTLFVGDSNPSGTDYDIVGLQTASISEFTLTQAKKLKGPDTLEKFVELVDGLHSESLGDVSIVASVGSNKLWMTTIVNSTASNQTVASFLREAGMSWSVRGEIDTNTAAGDFGAYVSLGRGLAGAAVVPVWSQGEMIRDVYTGAKKGEVNLTISTLFNFGLPRTANYKRLKFVT